ncbi:MAG: DUF927 domain-containing protein [Anaerolineae bacterium]|nr:DUF927 domain-containing protein [Anaerolineae bacterium]NUQ04685.1 DUF927 domain-containing protein [Anaerolineae bacterium]
MSIAQTDAPGNTPAWRDFLRALYKGAPDELYFELRCIHPTTGDARSLWSKVGDKRALTNAFNRGTTLNRENEYGLYFAPCLRSQKQGKVEAAALLPALWVDLDCDDDSAHRTAALEKLHAFNPLPSVIIDSGGGLHAYWLLKEPTSLIDEAARKQAAGMLRGLFSALGGDPQYVKSVASVMRLVGSVNTKPERGGVVVKLVELYPDRRYLLADFAWLESQPQVERIGSLNVLSLNGNGQHPLPKRTEDYLVSGAMEGSRNTELFQAACQLRDAGHSQPDAEAQLIPRYVAEGGSEREALATIRSVYSRPPRDPIQNPRDQVEHLVNRYSRQTDASDHPTVTQIAETVRACAGMNPVEWAETRQRLKSVCGDGLKVADLDRLYREARRERERSAVPHSEGAERYTERDGGMVYEKETERGLSRLTVADWTGRVLEWMMQVDDDGQVDRQMRLQLVHPTYSTTIDAPDELFGDPNALARFIAGKAGGVFSPRAGMQKHLAPAILKLSADAPRRQTYRFIGWTQIDDHWQFVSPDITVSAAGIVNNPPEVALESRLRDYGLKQSAWEDGLNAFRATIVVFPKELASVLIAFSLLPVMQRFFPTAAPKPALHLVGTTGSGKSEIAALMTSFYGEFTRDTPPAQWGDTVNTVEALGYTLADALYWVDDYKTCYADERTFTRFLQSYSRGMGRGRLTREAKMRQERPCRGLLLSTGETTIEGEASILARMLVLEIPPWEKRDPGGKMLARAEAVRRDLPVFTSAFIQWLADRADAGTLTDDLAKRFPMNAQGYAAKLQAKLGRQANTGRMVNNWAVLVSVYQLLHEFMTERGADDALPPWQDAIVATVQAVQQERAGRVFLDLLGQLLVGGQCVIDELSPSRFSSDHTPGTVVVGYREGSSVYLLPDLVLREINRTHLLRFTKQAIGAQLREDGLLIPGKDNLTVQKSIRGHVIRVWRMKPESMDCEGCETEA